MIEELDMVALTVDLPEYNLRTHDVGAVVLVHGDHDGYEVEFVTITGETARVKQSICSIVAGSQCGCEYCPEIRKGVASIARQYSLQS